MLKLPRTTTEAQAAILRDKETFGRMLREHTSQKSLAATLGVSSDTIIAARQYHGLPGRPTNMPLPPDLAGMTATEVHTDPRLWEILMTRAFSRANTCPPFCRYWGEKSCPKPNAMDFDAPDDEGPINEMHPRCPIRFYCGSDRNGDSPVYREFMTATPVPMPAAQKEEPIEKEPEPEITDPCERFMALVADIKKGR